MFSTAPERNQQKKRYLIQLIGSPNNFVIGNNIHADEAAKKTVETHNYCFKNSGGTAPDEDGQSCTQVIERDFADRIRNKVDSVVAR